MFAGDRFERRVDGSWWWRGQKIADDYESLRPKVAMMASLAGRKFKSWTRDGDIVRVTTERKRPCRRRR